MTYLTRRHCYVNDKKLHLLFSNFFEADRLLHYGEEDVFLSRGGQHTSSIPTIIANTPMQASHEKCSG